MRILFNIQHKYLQNIKMHEIPKIKTNFLCDTKKIFIVNCSADTIRFNIFRVKWTCFCLEHF